MDETIVEDLKQIAMAAVAHKREGRIAIAFLLFSAAIQNSAHLGENACASMAFRMADAFIARAAAEYVKG